jgi:hypothetical protein
MSTTVLTDGGSAPIKARWVDGRPWIAADSTGAILGWEVKPEGLCRGDECVLLDGIVSDGQIDLLEAAERTGRPTVADSGAEIVVLGAETAVRHRAIKALELPDTTLPTLSGENRSLRSWAGKKKLFVVFASW